jgi:hypothetical protein
MFNYLLFICLISFTFNVETIEGFKWVTQYNYHGANCNSTHIDYVIMFLMGKCTQDSPTTSFIEDCYNESMKFKFYDYKFIYISFILILILYSYIASFSRNKTHFDNVLCQGEPVSGKFYIYYYYYCLFYIILIYLFIKFLETGLPQNYNECINGVFLECVENPIMESWPGVGSWEIIPTSYDEEDGCSPAYGPSSIEAYPNSCERKSTEQKSSTTVCPTEEGSNTWSTNSYLNNYCEGNGALIRQQLITTCTKIVANSAAAVTAHHEFAQCTVLNLPGVVNLPTSVLAHIGGSEDAQLIIAGIAGIILVVLFVLSSITGLIYYYFKVYSQNTGVDDFLQGNG